MKKLVLFIVFIVLSAMLVTPAIGQENVACTNGYVIVQPGTWLFNDAGRTEQYGLTTEGFGAVVNTCADDIDSAEISIHGSDHRLWVAVDDIRNSIFEGSIMPDGPQVTRPICRIQKVFGGDAIGDGDYHAGRETNQGGIVFVHPSTDLHYYGQLLLVVDKGPEGNDLWQTARFVNYTFVSSIFGAHVWALNNGCDQGDLDHILEIMHS